MHYITITFKTIALHYNYNYRGFDNVMHYITITGKLRYLEFQGNGENTSSFPKFEIANYDVTRIHVHEQNFVHFRLNTLSALVKSAWLQNICTFVIRCVLFTHKYRGQIIDLLVQRTKLLDHFLDGILVRKRHFRGAFSAH